jgi:hypothetical protein
MGIFQAVMVREESKPPCSDFEIGPGGDDVWACSEYGVVVVFHDGIGTDLDGEDEGEML